MMAVDPSEYVMVESEVAFYLRQRLGPVLVWPFVLTGFRRAGVDDSPLPYRFRAGRRYYYTVSDVYKFADEFEASNPEAVMNKPAQAYSAGGIAPTHPKRRIRYRSDGLITIRPKAGTPATLH